MLLLTLAAAVVTTTAPADHSKVEKPPIIEEIVDEADDQIVIYDDLEGFEESQEIAFEDIVEYYIEPFFEEE